MKNIINKIIGIIFALVVVFGSTNTSFAATPTITISPATSITTTSATLNASYVSNGATVTGATFKYGSDPLMTSTVNGIISGTTVSANISGLTSGTQYYFELMLVSDAGLTTSTSTSFTTTTTGGSGGGSGSGSGSGSGGGSGGVSGSGSGGLPAGPYFPSATILPASNITSTTATLNASYNNNGYTITGVAFKYGSDPLMTQTINGPVPSATSGTTSVVISNLNASTVYYFEVMFISDAGITTSTSTSFTTAVLGTTGGGMSGGSGSGSGSGSGGLPIISTPTITISPATSITTTSATLNASYVSNGATVTGATFKYGSDPLMTSTVNGIISGTTVSANISGLTSGTQYYFELMLVSDAGLTTSTSTSFTTTTTGGSGGGSGSGSGSGSGGGSGGGITSGSLPLNSSTVSSTNSGSTSSTVANQTGSTGSTTTVTSSRSNSGNTTTASSTKGIIKNTNTTNNTTANSAVTNETTNTIGQTVSVPVSASNSLGAAVILASKAFLPITVTGWIVLIISTIAIAILARILFISRTKK